MLNAADPFTTLLTTAEAAELAGVSKAVIHMWVNRGHLTVTGKDGRGRNLFLLIDVAKAENATRKAARRKVAA